MNNEKEQKKEKNFKSLQKLYKYAVPYFPLFVVTFILILISTVLSLIQPKLIQAMIDTDLAKLASGTITEVEKTASINGIIKTTIIYFVVIFFEFFVLYFGNYMLNHIGQKIIKSIRKDLYEHILKLPMSFFDEHAIGNLVTRVTNDTENINQMFTTVLSSILNSFFSIIGIIIIMFSLNAKLAGVVLITMPLIIYISVKFQLIMRPLFEEQRSRLSSINSKLSENITGMRLIQIFNKQKAIYDEFDDDNSGYFNISHKEIHYFAMFRPAIEFVRTLGIALLIWFGGQGFLAGTITFGVVFAFTDYIERFYHPILRLTDTMDYIQSAMVSSGRIFDIMGENEENVLGKDVPENISGEIEFEHVWFSYDKDDVPDDKKEWILKDVSFLVKPGHFVAFVGATGAGKSTIMSLICRFYDINKGRIKIDGVDIREYDVNKLRRVIGVVQQDVFMFTGNVMDNITLNRENITETDAVNAAKLVHADEFVENLPEKYEQEVTERGSTFSSGQRQLLSFARTLASNPSLLILDEATANIDTQTEELIQDAIRNMSKNRTMIAVAHRISTISDADHIFVMSDGKIVEEGTKDALIAKNGVFRVLYELQYQKKEVQNV